MPMMGKGAGRMSGGGCGICLCKIKTHEPLSPSHHTHIYRLCISSPPLIHPYTFHTFSPSHIHSQSPVYDHHFNAMNAFRFIGYLISTQLGGGMGAACTQLWDPDNPLAWNYGPYEKTMCQPLQGQPTKG